VNFYSLDWERGQFDGFVHQNHLQSKRQLWQSAAQLQKVSSCCQKMIVVDGIMSRCELLVFGTTCRIPVLSPCGANNLHFYWDSAACEYLLNWSPGFAAPWKHWAIGMVDERSQSNW
jgi:hypothetical protein